MPEPLASQLSQLRHSHRGQDRIRAWDGKPKQQGFDAAASSRARHRIRARSSRPREHRKELY